MALAKVKIEEYRKWYAENVPWGVFAVRPGHVFEMTDNGDGTAALSGHNTGVAVGSIPMRFVIPIQGDDS